MYGIKTSVEASKNRLSFGNPRKRRSKLSRIVRKDEIRARGDSEHRYFPLTVLPLPVSVRTPLSYASPARPSPQGGIRKQSPPRRLPFPNQIYGTSYHHPLMHHHRLRAQKVPVFLYCLQSLNPGALWSLLALRHGQARNTIVAPQL